ncbi:MAG: hypothetical protein JXA60_12980 [Candidatus Coatesbacteria bacterium]|nr:hypothetical protein [Candidatus Coatesbacteria bacterium]
MIFICTLLLAASIHLSEPVLILSAQTFFDMKKDCEQETVLVDNINLNSEKLQKSLGNDYREIIYRCMPIRKQAHTLGVLQQTYWYSTDSKDRRILWSRLYPMHGLPPRVRVEVFERDSVLYRWEQIPGIQCLLVASYDLKVIAISEQTEHNKYRKKIFSSVNSQSVFNETFPGKISEVDPRHLVMHHNKVFHITNSIIYEEEKEVFNLKSLSIPAGSQMLLYPSDYCIAYVSRDKDNAFIKCYNWKSRSMMFSIPVSQASVIQFASDDDTLFWLEKDGTFKWCDRKGILKGQLKPKGRSLAGCGLMNRDFFATWSQDQTGQKVHNLYLLK